MTYKEIEELVDGLAPILKAYVAQQVAPIADRVAALEGLAPAKALDKPKWKHRGEWQPNAEYRLNDAVTRHKSLFICNVGRAPGSDPASDPICWRRASGAAA